MGRWLQSARVAGVEMTCSAPPSNAVSAQTLESGAKARELTIESAP